MKGKLIFDLDDEFDKNSFNRAINSTNAYLAINEIQNLLRSAEKYERIDHLELTEGQLIVIDKLKDKLYTILDYYRVNMEDLE